MEFEKSEEIESMLKIKAFSTYFLLKVTNIAKKSFVFTIVIFIEDLPSGKFIFLLMLSFPYIFYDLVK